MGNRQNNCSYVLFLFCSLGSVYSLLCGEILGEKQEKYTIALVKQRWHTGLVGDSSLFLCLADLLPSVGKVSGVDIGWGDSTFYQLPDFDIGAALSALFAPTSSVLRVYYIRSSVEQYLDRQEWVAVIALSKAQFEQLCQFLRQQFRHTPPEPISHSSTDYVHFFPARGKYSLLKTCNTWIAEALVAAGILSHARGIITVSQLFDRICPLALFCRRK